MILLYYTDRKLSIAGKRAKKEIKRKREEESKRKCKETDGNSKKFSYFFQFNHRADTVVL